MELIGLSCWRRTADMFLSFQELDDSRFFHDDDDDDGRY